MNAIRRWCWKRLGSHISFKVSRWHVTVYGFNAMHVAINIRTRKWGYICFHPPIIHLSGKAWPWYFYLSPNATPSVSTFAIGPGIDRSTRRLAKTRREMFGHNFNDDIIYDGPHRELLG